MVTTAASPRTPFAELATAPARPLRPALASIDDDTVLGLMVLSYLRDGSPYALWADTTSRFVEDLPGVRTWARLRTVLDAVADHPQVPPKSASAWADARRWRRSWPCGTSRYAGTARPCP
ncbi:hypothetical protein [Streptomyces sp. NBC_00151]|uniref:hypothetical protein n=1 Tax=Streptomyces sp. NBC_00151 TaxID=2975669 RepID=UPI002DDA1EC6|nr:hypothetical protein [Streptomyces sp. NBC_00151]WRZ36634.1 hypothetical protein OG915_00025 [Streptomyces sp. NBC_00151]WRZ44939.1 hypothetical protein OG915_47510 [Streptomyces sp. NBC_00151]